MSGGGLTLARDARRPARGFTLIEVLVALFIAALMFAMGYGAISQALTTRAALKEKQARLLELETAVRVLEQDFVQLTPRPVRQPIGDEPAQPALQGSAGGSQTSGSVSALGGGSSTQPASTTSGTPPLVALTRGGWANPNGLQRPAEQRVAYYFENGTLRREYWYVLDPTLSSTTARRELLRKVKSVTFEYLDLTHTWQPQWPTSSVGGVALESNLRVRPLAVRVTLDTEDFGKIVRIFEVAG